MSGLTLAQTAPMIGTAGTCLLLLGCFLVFLGFVRPKKKAMELQEPATVLEKTAAHIIKLGKVFKILGAAIVVVGAILIGYYFCVAQPTAHETTAIRRLNINNDDSEWMTWITKRYVKDKEGNDKIPGVNVRFKQLAKPDDEISYDESADGITFVRVDSLDDEAAYIISRATQTDYADGSAVVSAPNTAPMHYSEYDIVAYITEETLEKSGISTDVMVDSYDMPKASMFIDEVNNKRNTSIEPETLEELQNPDTEI